MKAQENKDPLQSEGLGRNVRSTPVGGRARATFQPLDARITGVGRAVISDS